MLISADVRSAEWLRSSQPGYSGCASEEDSALERSRVLERNKTRTRRLYQKKMSCLNLCHLNQQVSKVIGLLDTSLEHFGINEITHTINRADPLTH
jgi:hypothetical protein